jgi:hypothetical protein
VAGTSTAGTIFGVLAAIVVVGAAVYVYRRYFASKPEKSVQNVEIFKEAQSKGNAGISVHDVEMGFR